MGGPGSGLGLAGCERGVWLPWYVWRPGTGSLRACAATRRPQATHASLPIAWVAPETTHPQSCLHHAAEAGLKGACSIAPQPGIALQLHLLLQRLRRPQLLLLRNAFVRQAVALAQRW